MCQNDSCQLSPSCTTVVWSHYRWDSRKSLILVKMFFSVALLKLLFNVQSSFGSNTINPLGPISGAITTACSHAASSVFQWFVASVFILDEPLKLLRVVRTAVVGGPRVADGEFVELEHIHYPHFCHSTAEQVWTLVHACRCVCTFKICVTNDIPFTSHVGQSPKCHLHTVEEAISWVCVAPYGSQPRVRWWD